MTSSEPAQPGAHTAAADAEQHLREEIEQTRDQLGETVEALAGKADVPARARTWATGQADRARLIASRNRAAATAQAATVRDRLADTTLRERQQAAAAAAITLIAGSLVIRRWRRR